MQEETIEEKIRKIQKLFTIQVEIRIGTNTETDENDIDYHHFYCKLVSVDNNYQEHTLSFCAISNTAKINNIDVSEPSCATENENSTISKMLDELYAECEKFISHNYIVELN